MVQSIWMRVFFIGVCGTAMGNAAVLLKKMGHQVAGSDAGVYPPMSDVLSTAGIDLFEGFAEEEMLAWQPDRVVVGNAVSRGNPQVEYLLRTRGIPFVSLPQLNRGRPHRQPAGGGHCRHSWENHHNRSHLVRFGSGRESPGVSDRRGSLGPTFR